MLDLGAHGLLDDFSLPLVLQALESGVHDPAAGFTTAYFHTPQELADELDAFEDVEVFGVEGPAGPALDAHGIERVDEFLPSAGRGRAGARSAIRGDRRQRALAPRSAAGRAEAARRSRS
jgi:hypothetical protein